MHNKTPSHTAPSNLLEKGESHLFLDIPDTELEEINPRHNVMGEYRGIYRRPKPGVTPLKPNKDAKNASLDEEDDACS